MMVHQNEISNDNVFTQNTQPFDKLYRVKEDNENLKEPKELSRNNLETKITWNCRNNWVMTLTLIQNEEI